MKSTELRQIIREELQKLNQPITESLDAIKDFQRDHPNAKIYKAHGYDEKIEAETTTSTWPTGAPVTKKFKKTRNVHIPDEEFYVLETDKHWYICLDGGYWIAINKKKHPRPPFDY